MKIYTLFSEWRGIKIIGENLIDALYRQKQLKRPDKWANREKIEDGECCKIARVLGMKVKSETRYADTVRRGYKEFETAVVEFTDGKIEEIDATCESLTITPSAWGSAETPQGRKVEVIPGKDPSGYNRQYWNIMYRSICVGGYSPEIEIGAALKDADLTIDKNRIR
jgi:hypothetical protein